jgi:signal transduction histidine kinase
LNRIAEPPSTLHQGHLRDANQALLLAALRAQDAGDEARQEHDRQADFLHRLAHELRAPLAPLRTVVSLLGHTKGSEHMPAVQRVIERQVMHLAQMVEDLLDAARMRTGKLSLRIARVDLQEVLSASLQTCQAAVALREQSLDVNVPALPLALHGDPVRLTQVFSNLLSNASKYTPRGGHIELSVTVQSGHARISVTDNGIGITPQAIDSIFDAYVQEPHAVRHDDSGLGLGLTLARELVLAHSGSIRASSAGLGCGTRFDVLLPLTGEPDG